MLKACFGEFLGTFLLVFIGCGTVATAVLFEMPSNLLGVATVWGIGVALAIFASRAFSPAHLNPAVTFAFWLKGETSLKELFVHFISQLIGAIAAGASLYAVFQSDLEAFEQTNQIVRGTLASQKSAMMFGEFFPNPGYANLVTSSAFFAGFMEGLGTFLLVLSILILVSLKKLNKNVLPLLIGLSVTLIICMVAPYTQAGLNPARDFGPRLVAYFMGWGDAAFPTVPLGFFTVYILAPFLGALLAFKAWAFFTKIKKGKVASTANND